MTKRLGPIVALGFILVRGYAAGDEEPTAKLTPLLPGVGGIHTNDVIAFLGGADVAAGQETGHLEALLAVALHPLQIRFRNLGWEGSTVFERHPRDTGFPTQKEQLKHAEASLIFLQYGRGEALDQSRALPDFESAYKRLAEECLQQTPRVVLVTPPPFEKDGELLPDLSERNKELAGCARVIRELARAEHLSLVDLFSELGNGSRREPRLTENGLQLTPRGHALVARAFARQLGFGRVAERAGEADENGRWADAGFEQVRQAVLAKNQLWFHYWRPQNWAFLGGDRTSQPSSRDHRNPSVRWFPEEMERFRPLIQAAEGRINDRVEALGR